MAKDAILEAMLGQAREHGKLIKLTDPDYVDKIFEQICPECDGKLRWDMTVGIYGHVYPKVLGLYSYLKKYFCVIEAETFAG